MVWPQLYYDPFFEVWGVTNTMCTSIWKDLCSPQTNHLQRRTRSAMACWSSFSLACSDKNWKDQKSAQTVKDDGSKCSKIFTTNRAALPTLCPNVSYCVPRCPCASSCSFSFSSCWSLRSNSFLTWHWLEQNLGHATWGQTKHGKVRIPNPNSQGIKEISRIPSYHRLAFRTPCETEGHVNSWHLKIVKHQKPNESDGAPHQTLRPLRRSL